MDSKKLRTSLIAVTAAAAIALSGTFAWQSVSQSALNEVEPPVNPGGRLHDDFSGWSEGKTKDIYVENFGNDVIYARVRLTEYMEIGLGAGLKTGDAGYSDKNVTILKGDPATADINDPTTWSTHIPGATPQSPADPTTDEFHNYWTWLMGGQTVYMPTFNKNQDSLQPDINGTFDGTVAGDDLHYDDYIPYALGATETGTEYYDADADAIDECGPDGGPGGSGVLGTNYSETQNVTHTAKETLNGTVMTMAQYNVLPDTDPGGGSTWKGNVLAWVYDTDGWAYWSQPIQPNTATGLLLDRIVLNRDPGAPWYYGISAVAQFITADSLGRRDNPGTGFYDPDDGPAPTPDALDLLDGIGVDIAEVDGSVTVTAKGQDAAQTVVNYVTPDMTVNISALVDVPGQTGYSQSVNWKLQGNTDPNTHIDASTGQLIVGASETVGNTLRVVAESVDFPGLRGYGNLKVVDETYSISITPDDGSTMALPGASKALTAALTSNNLSRTSLPQTFTWALDTTSATYDSGTTLTPDASDSSKATLAVSSAETAADVTLTATSTDPTYASVAPGSITLPLTNVLYTLDITDDSTGSSVKDTTVHVLQGRTPAYTLSVTSNPAGSSTGGSWDWTSSNHDAATVAGNGLTATVTIPDNGTGSAVIKVTNSTLPLTASFTIMVDPVEYTVTLTRMVEDSYTGTDNNWYTNYFLNQTAASFDVMKQADADGKINYAAYSSDNAFKVTATDKVLVSASISTTDSVMGPKVNNQPVVVALSCPEGGVSFSSAGVTNATGVSALKLDGGTGLTAVTMGGSGAKTITASYNNGKITYANTDPLTLNISQPNEVINELVANNKHTTLGGVVNIDGTDFYILKTGSVTDSGGTAHSNAALLLTKDEIGEENFDTTSEIYEGSDVQSYISSWINNRSTLNTNTVPVTLQTRTAYNNTTLISSYNQKAFLLSTADVFGVNGTHSGSSRQNYTNDAGVSVAVYANGGDPLVTDELTPGITVMGELSNKIPDGRMLRHGAQLWWLRTPRLMDGWVAHVYMGETQGDGGSLSFASVVCVNSNNSRMIGVRPALWYDLT